MATDRPMTREDAERLAGRRHATVWTWGLIVLWGLVVALFVWPVSAPADDHQRIRGQASTVYDGDTFTLTGLDVRLWGVDAPELDQPCYVPAGSWRCGVFARSRLIEIIGGRDLECVIRGKSYERVVAFCWVWNVERQRWEDVASLLVLTGHAVDVPEYSGGLYAGLEAWARERRKAVWAGGAEGMVSPSEWRNER